MRIEIDQSGKIEQKNMDTVIALSNRIEYSVLLPKEVKRRLIDKYKKEKQLILKLFVICLYYTLENYLHEIVEIVIDKEYEGKDDYIKSLLISFIRKVHPNFDKNFIRFSQITKKSRAHEVAANVKRGKIKPQRILSENDIENMIRGAL